MGNFTICVRIYRLKTRLVGRCDHIKSSLPISRIRDICLRTGSFEWAQYFTDVSFSDVMKQSVRLNGMSRRYHHSWWLLDEDRVTYVLRNVTQVILRPWVVRYYQYRWHLIYSGNPLHSIGSSPVFALGVLYVNFLTKLGAAGGPSWRGYIFKFHSIAAWK